MYFIVLHLLKKVLNTEKVIQEPLWFIISVTAYTDFQKILQIIGNCRYCLFCQYKKINKWGKVSHREPRGYEEGNALISKTVFIVSLLVASQPEAHRMLLPCRRKRKRTEEPVPDSCLLSSVQQVYKELLFSCRCAVILQILHQKLIPLLKALIFCQEE